MAIRKGGGPPIHNRNAAGPHKGGHHAGHGRVLPTAKGGHTLKILAGAGLVGAAAGGYAGANIGGTLGELSGGLLGVSGAGMGVGAAAVGGGAESLKLAQQSMDAVPALMTTGNIVGSLVGGTTGAVSGGAAATGLAATGLAGYHTTKFVVSKIKKTG
jgi:hypothetical protein